MRANELRLGNLIEFEDGSIIEVKGLHPSGNYIHNGKQYIEIFRYKPIPLTEEWFGRFGYQKQGYTGVCFHPDLGNAPVITIQEDGFYYEYTKIEYVHHFQNLCFVLTLQELEMKQKPTEV